jgi:predicted transcriptional regulator
MERPDLYVVARLLEALWRNHNRMRKTSLQMAAGLNYNVFTKYLEFLKARGLATVHPEGEGERVELTARGYEAHRFLVGGLAGVLGVGAPAGIEPKRAAVEELLWIHSATGIMVAHFSRRLTPHADADILSGMFTAIQAFMRDTFRSEGTLESLTIGPNKVRAVRGEHLTLVALFSEGDGAALQEPMKAALARIESKHRAALKAFSGRLADLARLASDAEEEARRGELAPF